MNRDYIITDLKIAIGAINIIAKHVDGDVGTRLLGHALSVAAAVEMLEGQAWQPMETARKDGSRILGWFPGSRHPEQVFAMSWRENIYEKGDPNWTLDDGESANLTYDPPEKWMPLPKPMVSA